MGCILESKPVVLVHRLDGGSEESRGGNTESKGEIFLGEIKISVSAALSYFLTEDFSDP